MRVNVGPSENWQLASVHSWHAASPRGHGGVAHGRGPRLAPVGSFEPGDKTGLRLSPHLAPSTLLARRDRSITAEDSLACRLRVQSSKCMLLFSGARGPLIKTQEGEGAHLTRIQKRSALCGANHTCGIIGHGLALALRLSGKAVAVRTELLV